MRDSSSLIVGLNEYDGGHIEGAVNFADKGRLSSHHFDVKPM
jgi:hypothetical protein